MALLIETLRDLWRLLDRRGRWLSGLLVLLLAVSGGFEMVAMMFLFGFFTALGDSGATGGNPVVRIYLAAADGLHGADLALATGAVLVGVFLLKNAFGLGTMFFAMRFVMKRYERVASGLFEGFLNIRLDLLSQRGTVVQQQILSTAPLVFQTSFTAALEILSDIAVFATIVATLMFMLDPWFVIGTGVLFGSVGSIFMATTRQMSLRLGARRIEAERALIVTMLDGFRGLIDVRLGERQAVILQRFRSVANQFALADRRTRALELIPRSVNEMLLAAGIVIAAVYFAHGEGGMASALSSLAVMGFAGLRMAAAMSRLFAALQRIRQNQQQRQLLMQAIRENAPALMLGAAPRSVVDYLVDDRPLPEGVSPRLERRIALERVSFTYPGAEAPAIRDLSLEIPRGAFTAFCGPSGGGKSTLALILMGLLRPQAGTVRCDDWDVFQHPRAWHGNLGYVGQAPFISPRSVRENVAFGYEAGEIDDAQVWRALEMASLAEVIRARPGGLDSHLGEEGAQVSGGQRQRLIIARALYRNPDVLVFDEATAALDGHTEREVTRAIKRLSGVKTVICIAHRLSTIRGADVIHVVEDGRIVASGTYDSLDQGSEAFRRIAHGQVEPA